MSHVVRVINDLAAAWEPAIWRASWQGGIALLLAWILCRLLRRAPAAVHCWIWRLAYLKLLIALLWARAVALPVLAPAPEPMVANATIDLGPQPAVTLGEVPRRVHSAVAKTPAPAIHPTVAGLLMLAWSVALVVGLARLTIAWRLTRRWRRDGEPCGDGDLLALRDRLADTIGVRRVPELLRSADVSSPLLLGLRRPAVLLPSSALETNRAAALRVILAHELAHVKRLDLAWDWMPAAAGLLFFFHPLSWLANREWHVSREIACDELARRAAGASPPEYGRVLLGLVDGQRRPRSPAALAVGIGERAGHFKRRIRAMTQSHTWSKRRLAVAGFALAAVTVVGTVPWRLVAQETTPQPTAPSKSPPAATPPAAGPAALDGAPARRGAEREATPEGRLRFPAQVTAATVEIRAPVDGTLKQVSVTEGQAVKRGDKLFQFDDGREQAAIQIAKAHFQSAAVRLRRMQAAKDTNQVSAQEFDDAQSAREVAEAELVSAERDLANRAIDAPIAGAAAECGVVAGQYVGKGCLLTTIVGTSALKVEFGIPQALTGDPRLKQPCRVVLRSQPGEPTIPAKIVYVAPRVESQSGTVLVKAALDAHDTDRLKAGMYVEVELGTDDKAPAH